jgi:hypothetical protein
MNKKMDDLINTILDGVMKDIKGEKGITFKVADLPDNIREEFVKIQFLKRGLSDDIDLKHKEFEMRLQREMDLMFDDRIHSIRKMEDDIWNVVYDQLNLDPNKNYSVNVKKREIREIVQENTNPFSH